MDLITLEVDFRCDMLNEIGVCIRYALSECRLGEKEWGIIEEKNLICTPIQTCSR